MSNANPLIKHFRQAKIYVQLPSRGQWYPDEFKESLSKEIQVNSWMLKLDALIVVTTMRINLI